MRRLSVKRRGRFDTLTLEDGTPVRAELYGCTVLKESKQANRDVGFLTLDIETTTPRAKQGIDTLKLVDARIRREASPRFSPLGHATVIAKVTYADVRFETWDGAFAVPFQFRQGMRVDAVLRLGAFGSFGYCWLLERVKRHDASDDLVTQPGDDNVTTSPPPDD